MTLDLEPLGREIVHPVTGEILNLSGESIERLAELTVDLQKDRESIAAFDQALSDALLAHLDRSALWTQRVGEPTDDVQYELKAPSPTAGTESYPPDRLGSALDDLVGADVISEDAASNALQRRLLLELEVPWGANLSEMAKAVKDAIGITVADVDVKVARAEPSCRPSASGIKALRKIPGAVATLDEALVTQDPPKRRVKVTVKTKGSR
jgi:hypothetical protein